MKKHIALGLCLLLSAPAQAHSHKSLNTALKKVIKENKKAIKRGSGSSHLHLAAIVSALQDANTDINNALSILRTIKDDMINMGVTIDASVAEIEDQINALATIAGEEAEDVLESTVANDQDDFDNSDSNDDTDSDNDDSDDDSDTTSSNSSAPVAVTPTNVTIPVTAPAVTSPVVVATPSNASTPIVAIPSNASAPVAVAPTNVSVPIAAPVITAATLAAPSVNPDDIDHDQN